MRFNITKDKVIRALAIAAICALPGGLAILCVRYLYRAKVERQYRAARVPRVTDLTPCPGTAMGTDGRLRPRADDEITKRIEYVPNNILIMRDPERVFAQLRPVSAGARRY